MDFVRMKRPFALVPLVPALLFIAGCEGLKQDLGLGKRSPDEYTVFTRQPLAVPPNFALRPPATGAPEQSIGPRDTARDALLGRPSQVGPVSPQAEAVASVSPGTREFLAKTGGLNVPSDIRNQVNRETAVMAEADRSFTERLMFWSKPKEYGQVVQADAEAQRIRQTQATGQPITTGPTPTIERKKTALLEGLFN